MDTMAKKLLFANYIIAAVLLVFSGCKTVEKAQSGRFVLRVNCGAYDVYTDKAGNKWLPDQYKEDDATWGAVYGMTVERGDLGITGTDTPRIYETERYSMDAYEFVIPNGTYTVRLHFAETYEGITDAGQRVFSVSVNGKTVLENFDLFKEAGFEKPVVKEYKGVTVTDKKLTIGFVPNIENPEINGIEIIAE